VAKDLTGKRFGRLIVIKRLNRKNHDRLYLCKCDCGNEITCLSGGLNKGTTTSCGCFQKEVAREKAKENGQADRFKRTRIGSISSRKLLKTNNSGVKGVGYRKDIGKWRARIQFQSREIALGCFDNKEDAIKARKEAEEKYFKPIIEEFETLKDGVSHGN